MIKWILYKIDHLIHKVIPHPPCEKTHLNLGRVVTTRYPSFNANSTANATSAYTSVTYTNFP